MLGETNFIQKKMKTGKKERAKDLRGSDGRWKKAELEEMRTY